MSNQSTALDLEVVPDEVKAAALAVSAPAEQALSLFSPFQAPFAAAAELLKKEAEATDAASARRLRLDMVKARTLITKTKDAAKADIKIAGNIIDWYHNKGRDQLADAEARLREIEEAEERKEAACKEALRITRTEELAKYGADGKFYNLGEMPDDGYAQLVEASKIAHATRLKAEADAKEAERIAAEKAEAERIAREKAEAEERERQRVENERLKREAAEREAALQAEREAAAKAKAEAEARERALQEKAEQERRAAEESARKEREAMEAKAREEKRKADEAAKAEREAREKAEAELRAAKEAEQARIEADAKAKAEKEAAEAAAKAAAEQAPDREKLTAFAAQIRALRPPKVSSAKAKEIERTISEQIEKFAAWLDAQAAKLGGAK